MMMDSMTGVLFSKNCAHGRHLHFNSWEVIIMKTGIEMVGNTNFIKTILIFMYVERTRIISDSISHSLNKDSYLELKKVTISILFCFCLALSRRRQERFSCNWDR